VTNSEQEREKCFLEESRDEQLFLFKFFFESKLIEEEESSGEEAILFEEVLLTLSRNLAINSTLRSIIH